MGDMSAEPSMEDILASIKRVIKEGEAPPAPRRAAPRAIDDDHRDAVLELNEPLAAPAPMPAAAPAPAPTAAHAPASFTDAAEERTVAPAYAPSPTPAASSYAAPSPATPLADDDANPAVSPATVEATRGALGALSRLVVKPEPDSDGTLEGLVRDMLRPMLGEWLDQNLPRLVEQMVAREIAKITNPG
ncbi:MAG: DUF2497 domain-containing protein [Sphingomonas taxi]|uniref:DUF2497 domain-containing protein n=1 Tax=Sphingomonas taxi TaxID=1549858 RepID=A0A2W5P0T1_9SPHN|nr:MAG: DUF2497 domain-containing protein [Sphingomonas taxi]